MHLDGDAFLGGAEALGWWGGWGGWGGWGRIVKWAISQRYDLWPHCNKLVPCDLGVIGLLVLLQCHKVYRERRRLKTFTG